MKKFLMKNVTFEDAPKSWKLYYVQYATEEDLQESKLHVICKEFQYDDIQNKYLIAVVTPNKPCFEYIKKADIGVDYENSGLKFFKDYLDEKNRIFKAIHEQVTNWHKK